MVSSNRRIEAATLKDTTQNVMNRGPSPKVIEYRTSLLLPSFHREMSRCAHFIVAHSASSAVLLVAGISLPF